MHDSRVFSLAGALDLPPGVLPILNLVLQPSQYFYELLNVTSINPFSLPTRKNCFPLLSFKNAN